MKETSKTKAIDIHGFEVFLVHHQDDESRYINCRDDKVVEIVIGNDVNEIYCHNNFLTELHIPNWVVGISCENNQLKELNLPDSVHTLWCDSGLLDYSKLKKGIEVDVYYGEFDRF